MSSTYRQPTIFISLFVFLLLGCPIGSLLVVLFAGPSNITLSAIFGLMLFGYLFGLKAAALSCALFLLGCYLAIRVWECDQITLKHGVVVGGLSGFLVGSLLSFENESAVPLGNFLSFQLFLACVSVLCSISSVRFSKLLLR